MKKKEVDSIFSKANSIITGDHFVYAKKPDGWYHGSAYVNKDAIYPYVRSVRLLCRGIADHFLGNGVKADVVVGPTVGAVSLSRWVAYHYAPSAFIQEVLSVYADEVDEVEEVELDPAKIMGVTSDNKIKLKNVLGEVDIILAPGSQTIDRIVYRMKVGTTRILKRGYDKVVQGKRCLVVEDVINSGVTVVKTVDAIRAAGGEVIGVGALCNRSGGKVTANTLGVPELFSLLDLRMEMFKEDECPICKEHGPESVRTDLGKGKEFLVRKGLI